MDKDAELGRAACGIGDTATNNRQFAGDLIHHRVCDDEEDNELNDFLAESHLYYLRRKLSFQL